MKSVHKYLGEAWIRNGRNAAFTLPEIMIVAAIFSLLVVSLLSSQVFGMRMYQIAQTKLAATSDGRKALNRVRDEIREGKMLMIGNGNNTSFSNVADNLQQLGNAIQIYPTTNLAVYTRYYLDTSDNSLKRVSSASSQPQVVASFITNRMIFQAEDFQGNVLTNDQNNRVIRMTMEFYRWEYPIASVGSGGMYDYYRLQTRITRRMIE